MNHFIELTCSHCGACFPAPSSTPIRFCINCGAEWTASEETFTQNSLASSPSASSVISFIPEHLPIPEEIQFSIGPYQIIKTIGKGGMGEVFLAYDTACGRRIALKRIRSDLLEHVQMHSRFLKEAHITSQLTHPAIISIYAIHQEEGLIYYTMPFIEGKTLKEIVLGAKAQEKKTDRAPDAITTIPSLMRIFLTICQAVAYAHSKGVLHRDLKPKNIIIGSYGEVMLLDWGLAKQLYSTEPEIEDESLMDQPNFDRLTCLGKVVGTIDYMAPERAFGQPATFQTDIYSLGVILYQLLTLCSPFERGTLKKFRKNLHKEVLKDPTEVAPYRDIPKTLSEIVKKCLDKDLHIRYQTVNELIVDLENFIEGRSEWFLLSTLKIDKKEDWEFQEHILLSEHIAITRGKDLSDWVSLMISRHSFNGNICLETQICLGENSHGIGFMLCIPETGERQHINDGYCIWLGSDLSPHTKLLRSTLEVVSRPEIFMQRGSWYTVRLEKLENNIHIYLNGVLQFSYISHIPMVGTHVGVLYRDADFMMHPLSVYVSSLNIMVNCLAVPDAFLAHKNYTIALSEYRRIAYSFPGRTEGREALFKAGITLLEQARNTVDPQESQILYDLALEEFSKQHNTAGAPFEYLGKGLVYQALRDYEEEVKCYELAFRRYPSHPLISILYKQVIYRMIEYSQINRVAAYNFILLAVRFIPKSLLTEQVRKLFQNVQKHWAHLDFIEDLESSEDQQILDLHFAIQLAFWLAKPFVLEEMIDELLRIPKPSCVLLSNALYSLIELGAVEFAQVQLDKILETLAESDILEDNALIFQSMVAALNYHQLNIEQITAQLLKQEIDLNRLSTQRLFFHLCRTLLNTLQTELLLKVTQSRINQEIPFSVKLHLDCYRIWALLLEEEWIEAGVVLQSYSLEMLSEENSLLHFLYGCWLLVTEGKEIANVHFATSIDSPIPLSCLSVANEFDKIAESDLDWLQKSFLFEKRLLTQQLALFYHCADDKDKFAYYHWMEQRYYVQASP